MALRVYGVVMQDGQPPPQLPEPVKLIGMRELAAVTEEIGAQGKEPDDTTVTRHLEVVGSVFEQDTVLPTPVGTTFRSADVLQRWMELHYVALSDALAWVEGRVAARVHITRAQARESDKEAGSDLAAIAADITRTLRRHAVSTVPLRNEEVTGIVLTAAYLVERELFPEFNEAAREEADRHPLVSLEVTGPWPPYDFVKMQFGG